jgi:SSS family solute:Na+ symporter
MQPQQSLGIARLSLLLVSAHYGLAFILGTGEEAYDKRYAGSLYPVSAAVGVLLLAVAAPYLQAHRKHIWETFAERYGHSAGTVTAFSSWLWMLGVAASQVYGVGLLLPIGSGYQATAMLLASLAIVFLAERSMQVQGWFVTLLVCSTTAVLLIALSRFDAWGEYARSPVAFAHDVGQVTLDRKGGIIICTILLTVLGADFQQYVLAARARHVAIVGCIAAATVLLLLAFLPSTIVVTAANRDPALLGQGRNSLPTAMDAVLGGPLYSAVTRVLFVTLAIACGASIARAMKSAACAAVPKFTTKTRSRMLMTVVAICAIALFANGIIELIVSFYAVYLGAVLVPFIISLPMFQSSVTSLMARRALQWGLAGSVFAFAWKLAAPNYLNGIDKSLLILSSGFVCSIAGASFGVRSVPPPG